MILQVESQVAAEPVHVWRILIDWVGQSRWIPFTTVDIISDHDQGIGVRAVALSGFRLGGIPVGLLDNFVVTGWKPAKELEVLHLGPYFTGEGAFRLEPHHGGTRVTATEVFSLRGGRPVEAIVGLGMPLMRAGFRRSLRGLAAIAEGGS
jgi:hypothetical protein